MSKYTIKLISVVLAIMLLCGCGASSVTSQDTSASQQTDESKAGTSMMTGEDITCYFYDLQPENKDSVTLYFKNGNRQIPYMDIETVRELMIIMNNTDQLSLSPDTMPYDLTVKTEGQFATFTRENGYSMVIDFEKDIISFLDYDKFMIAPYKITINDILDATGYDSEGKPYLFQRVKENSYDRYGVEWELNLAKYGIDLIYENGQYYIPMQTVADVLLWGVFLLYNTKEMFVVYSDAAYSYGSGEPSELFDRYYSVELTDRSQELIDYSYNELCFALDSFYGLKKSHDISSFDEYFECLEVKGRSMKEMFLSSNPRDNDIALAQLMLRDLDDNHSNYILPSAYTGFDDTIGRDVQLGISNREYNALGDIFFRAREKQYPKGVPGYEEIGNTAYITFDGFNSPDEERDLYKDPPTEEDKDTISLLIYAHSQIMREGSPIKNVVMDLSCNSGGECDTAVLVCAWFLGETPLYLSNPNTGSSSCTSYRCDMNLDREFNEKDTLEGKNLYCMISPLSFSCGNLTPNVFNASHRVTLLGQTSGGGSCAVLPMTTATGSMFQTSSSYSISIIKNGAYYNVDQGASPDIPLTRPESYYNRTDLTSYINTLR